MSRKTSLFSLALCLCVPLTILRADLISHWPMDGEFEDVEPAANDGTFVGEEFPIFGDGFDGAGEASAVFDGIDDYVELPTGNGLPIYNAPAYSIAMWVKGMPQPDNRVYSEANSIENTTLFNIGTDNTAATGAVDIFIRTAGGATPHGHTKSTRPAFDGTWHHIAWVDEGGDARLYVDGVLDETDFSYNKVALDVDYASFGAVVRPSRDPLACCLFNGEIDDVYIFDHALTDEEVLDLLPLDLCPDDGDTHCLTLDVTPPESGLGTPGIYTLTADAEDDSGDAISYIFTATQAGQDPIRVGPQASEIAEFDLGQGTWLLEVSVDDSGLCPDVAADAACDPVALNINCPAVGDTHCEGLDIVGPLSGGLGTYSVAASASDDSGDIIFYTFSAENEEGLVLTAGTNTTGFADFNIQTQGEWTFRVAVDDDPDCDDEAGDAVCEDDIDIVCPADGDTHCDDLIVDGPAGIPGTYTISVLGATDDSGDFVQYTFRATSSEGISYEVGPIDLNTQSWALGEGTWTIEVEVDDDPLCDDTSESAICSTEIDIDGGEAREIAYWPFDGELEDVVAAHDGNFFGGAEFDPLYVEGFDGEPGSALQLDGVDDYVEFLQGDGLPLYAFKAFTIAMWVKGLPQNDRRIWSEGYTMDNAPLFNLGTEVSGTTGTLDFYLRGGAGVGVARNHQQSDREPFDGEWHHIAWVDDAGDVTCYIDGIPDGTNFDYERIPMALDVSSTGAVLRAAACCWFGGALDEIHTYNYALSEAEVLALIPEPDDCSGSGDTHAGGIEVTRPVSGFTGIHTLTATGATDDSGDEILYWFIASAPGQETIARGPGPLSSVDVNLGEGNWTIRLIVDDNLLCRNQANDAEATTMLRVEAEPAVLLTHLRFDGDLIDSAEGENDGEYFGAPETPFVDDVDGNAESAVSFDGQDDYVRVAHNDRLPLYNRGAFSVAMWVRGTAGNGFNDRRVWSESTDQNNSALFNIGTHNTGADGTVDFFLRTAAGTTVVNHRHSTRTAFDGSWHHIAWSDDNGDVVLYIDGVPDETDMSYPKPEMDFNISTVGGILRQTTCCHFPGDIDDVRLYTYAISQADVTAIIGGGEGPVFHRGDPDDDGVSRLTDGVYVLNWLFTGGEEPTCLESADANNDGVVNLTDGVAILNYLFTGGEAPASPGPAPAACGPDPAGGVDLGCASYTSC